jgi:gliding motility-associated-like protein
MPVRRTIFTASLLAALLATPFMLMATHQRASEITYRHLTGLTYEITLISYTYTPSPANAYRDYLTIDWGDGTFSEIPRIEIRTLPGDISYNRYKGQHTFPGPASYTISCEDPNRNGGILNIPNSINVPLFIYSELIINPFMGGYNNSPVLLIPPIDNACVEQPFYHNPGAYDADGDSLSYRLVTCYGAMGLPIPGYTLPPATNFLTLDSITGDLIWDSPPNQGEYNIAILIEEWREGIKIGSVLRDMQIIVVACDNKPPVFEPVMDTCVEAGKELTFTVTAYDPDSNIVRLTGTGGPLVLPNNHAFLNPDPAIDTGHVSTQFSWATVCEHVKKNPYTMYFKAQDNGSPVSLVSILSMNILVVGPAPENLTAIPLGNTITLNWDDYTCQNAAGYYIYRKPDSTGFVHGYCETGVPPYLGYQKIGEINGIGQTSYLDDNNGTGLFQGIRYCYMVVAWYPDKAEGYASNEACAQLKRDLPVLTNVSINTTDPTTGSVYTAWSKPTEIDSVQAPGPYKYILLRSRSDLPNLFIAIDSMNNLNDTLFTDTLLNTRDHGFRYRVDLYNVTPGMRFLIGSSQPAASMYLTVSPTDETLNLGWTNAVPWTNDTFAIYRKGPFSSTYDSVGFSPVNAYSDKGLRNGDEFCYRIKSRGNYSASGFVDPIINFSQFTCGIPVDNVPPCAPVLTVTTRCEEQTNVLTWLFPGDTCSHDVARILVYYSPLSTQDPVLTDSIAVPGDTAYMHSPPSSVVGCYVLQAVDSVGNVSDLSNKVCIDYTACPVYELPNVFTPNGDGFNDFFVPFPYSSVEKINLVIVDRWGREVFHTSDPDIRWNGDDETTKQPCSDGVYLYVCDVFEITLEGTRMRTLRGSVTILR